MARPKRRDRGVKGRPWYRKYNDTWYIDYDDKQLPIKDEHGGNVKGAENREQAERCWVLMQAHMMAPAKGEENHIRLIFGKFLDHIQKDHSAAYNAYRR